jgi:hypothetical protein
VQENQKRRNHAKEQPTKTGKVQFQVVSPLPLKNNSSSKKFQRVPHTDSNEYVWQTLGLRVKAFSKAKFDEINPCVNSNYEFHGAVQVLEIREDSLFYQHGLRKNDFLVGLITSPKNAWNITSVDDLFYVANYWKEIGQADFLAVRNQNLLTGKISGPLK